VLSIIQRWSTVYRKGQHENKNYKQAPAICTEALGWFPRNAIEDTNSFFTASTAVTVTLAAAGDETTWGDEGGANCEDEDKPPKWQHSLEVEVDPGTSAGAHRHRRQRREWLPVSL
jgi:hypothetical protein